MRTMVNIMVNIMLIITFGSLDWKVKIVQYAFNEVPETHRKFFLREEFLQKDPARCNIMFASSRSRTVAYISYFFTATTYTHALLLLDHLDTTAELRITPRNIIYCLYNRFIYYQPPQQDKSNPKKWLERKMASCRCNFS